MSSDESGDEDDDQLVVAMDTGTSRTKAGFAGNKTVSCHIPTVYGRVRPESHPSDDGKTFFIGDEACERRSRLSLYYPVEKGIIVDFDKMEKIWEHILFKELHKPGEGGWYGPRLTCDDEFSMLLTESPTNPSTKHEKMAEVMFETFNVCSLKIPFHHECALIAEGVTTGVVVDSGESSTDVLAIHKGQVVQDSLVHIPFGGRDLTDFLSINLAQSQQARNLSECIDVRSVKHSNIFFSLDANYEEEWKNIQQSKQFPTYTTSKGTSIELDYTTAKCPELLFHPQTENAQGIHHAVHSSVLACPEHMHADLYNNILLVGGNTIFCGVKERMLREMRALVPSTLVERVHVRAPPERIKSVWIGGSIMGSVGVFLRDFVGKDAYEEHGSNIMLKYRYKPWSV